MRILKRNKKIDRNNKTDYEIGWDSYSDIWDESVKKDSMEYLGDEWGNDGMTNEVINEYVIPYIRHDMSILEIGCGGGKFSERLAPLCKKLVCSDVSSKMLERSKNRIKKNKNTSFEKLNGFDLHQFESESFDFVFSFDVFVHIDMEDIYSYLQDINRILSTNGKGILHCANLNSQDGWNKFREEVPINQGKTKIFDRFRFLTWEIVERFLTSFNFKILKVKKEPWRDILTLFEKQA